MPSDLASELASQASKALADDTPHDRWGVVLDALAFSPVRGAVTPAGVPAEPSAELIAEVRRLSDRIPAIAALFGVDPAEVPKSERRRRSPRHDRNRGKGKGKGKGNEKQAKDSDSGSRREPRPVPGAEPKSSADEAASPTPSGKSENEAAPTPSEVDTEEATSATPVPTPAEADPAEATTAEADSASTPPPPSEAVDESDGNTDEAEAQNEPAVTVPESGDSSADNVEPVDSPEDAAATETTDHAPTAEGASVGSEPGEPKDEISSPSGDVTEEE